jgi:hypothetical protein
MCTCLPRYLSFNEKGAINKVVSLSFSSHEACFPVAKYRSKLSSDKAINNRQRSEEGCQPKVPIPCAQKYVSLSLLLRHAPLDFTDVELTNPGVVAFRLVDAPRVNLNWVQRHYWVSWVCAVVA